MIKLFLTSITLLQLLSCGSTQLAQKDYRNLVIQKNYDEAKKILNTNKMYNDDNSKLLQLLELALLEHYQNNYKSSVQLFEEAKELSDKLYTVSIKKKIASFAANDQSDNYYAEKFEQSQIRFYLTLNYLLLYHKTKEQEFVTKARASLLEWDTLLENFKEQFKGNHVFKQDMAHKILGSICHELVGTTTDKQIAINLLKSAKELLFKNYNSYQTYNKKYRSFIKNFGKLHKMKIKDVKKNHVAATKQQKRLRKYINKRLKRLKSTKLKTHNTFFFVQNGTITKKYFTTMNIPNTSGESSTIEIPAMKRTITKGTIKLVIKGAKDFKKRVSLATINPLSQISYEEFSSKIGAIKKKMIARLATKHGLAAVASIGASAALAKGGGDNAISGAIQLSMMLFSLGSHLITASEHADIRQWVSLPHDVHIASVKLPFGDYKTTLEYSKKKIIYKTKPGPNFHVGHKLPTILSIKK